MEKLYVVVREDLPPAQQAVQAMHAARELQDAHPEAERAWHERSNTIALLAVPDEPALAMLARSAELHGLRVAMFREPDLADAATAVALLGDAKRLLRDLPRALGGR